VRPVNLIPLDERRGTARGGSAATGIRVYILLGALGAALICVLALVLTANNVNSRKQELAKVQVEQQGVKQVADALRPYGQFAQLQQARQQQIASFVSSRFDWERSLRQLSRAIPANVWILNLDATLDPTVEVEGSGGGGDLQSLRQQSSAPAFAITGCAFSHHAVARMMVRMQNLDDVTRVRFGDSARKEDDSATATAGQPAQVQPGQASEQDSADCVGSSRVTKFDILVEFGNAPSAAASSASPDAGAVPTSAAQNLGKAQAAGEQAQAASSTAAASATSATGGAK
jgi:Tfp pilus assembly protein PilN